MLAICLLLALLPAIATFVVVWCNPRWPVLRTRTWPYPYVRATVYQQPLGSGLVTWAAPRMVQYPRGW